MLVNNQNTTAPENGRYTAKIMNVFDVNKASYKGVKMIVVVALPDGGFTTQNVLVFDNQDEGSEMINLLKSYSAFTGNSQMDTVDLIGMVGKVDFWCALAKDGNIYPHLNHWDFIEKQP